MSQLQSDELRQLWICIGVCALLFAAIAILNFEVAIIYGTCMAGSYLLIRGFSLLAGGYPNEFMIYDSLVNEKFLS